MNPTTLSLVLTTMISGTLIVMTSSHWFMAWVGFEMNMLAMIPLLTKEHNPRSTEAATKYLLTQATASMLLMMAAVTNLLYTGHWSIMKLINPMASIMMTMALTMKLGLSPFHFWVPEVVQGIPLMSGLILLTWQKLAPLSILYMITPLINTDLLLIMSLMSIAIGGWGGLNQTQLRKIMAYSSIAHMGWMLAILTYNPTMTLLNLYLYIPMTITTFMLLMLNSATTTTSLSHMWNKLPLITVLILTTMLSLGGLPPLTGFLPKWAIIQEMTKNNNIIIPMLMTFMALLNLYFYTRITYTTSLTMFPTANNMKMKWQFKMPKQMMHLPSMVAISTMILPLAPIMMILE
uniref:NADH-ubiquinone oxidoreductase chain 2 n=2 Tax=Myotis TaxID=9434 RepID=A0A343LGA0_9CHIR|nr:NADH dehydrogenase subunit 2 [Myotis muricola]YP_009442730.1 NADH dehydrogenase subunit 2 [Myotis atacamensis]AMB65560.1 NADH dehydrogenase subunit 2 [Myotis muricola]ATO90557.1 NADH dehydrogenase subunit 2 [Myotis atacamensis]